MLFLKRLLIGACAGLVSGTFILGIGGRLAMRLIAMLGGLPGGFSWGGSFEVVALGSFIGLLSGAIFGMIEKLGFQKRAYSGLLYGALVFGSIIILPIEGKGAAAGFPKLLLIIYLIFGNLFLLYGWALATLFDRWNPRT